MPNKRPRGPQPHWRPKRETLRVLTAVDTILDRYRDHLPISLRQTWYVLLSDGVMAKIERDYKRMCEYVGMARRSGRIPWDAIRDDTQIAVEAPPSFAGPGDFFTAVDAAVDDYRVDRQTGQPVRLELWCETAGMVPQLVRIGEGFGIACFSGGGFDGLAGKHDAAMRAVEGGRKTLVLHIGDYDPSGEHLFNSLAEDVIAFAQAAGAEVEFERVAVTPEQIATYDLPTAPPKATDRRSFSGTTTTQAEALPPDILATIVREAIAAHRDLEVHRQALAREEAERRAIRERLGRWSDPGEPPAG
ncbi:hypothetical protein [Streptomyces noursei]|uniref:hypothetical protein n=1 Tax=Streptomyces noursei TaxID=1971 RepID=UPI00167833F6|nr:hypothetical protein [Streptomyces noursei]MCZ1021409.1 hypothetical protein [Streptomyces noursei]GGX46265.1 hypothetical protein GCM10010341_79960 [Streptomyces noursei]